MGKLTLSALNYRNPTRADTTAAVHGKLSTMSSFTPAFATPAPTPSRTSDALYASSRAFMCGRQCSVTSRTSAKSRVTMVLGEETEKAVWPPAGMTEEWAAAVVRLQKSVRGETLSSADGALAAADGDEVEALMILTDESNSSIRRQREMAVQKERESGNDKRVSALKEAQLRRIATGSYRIFVAMRAGACALCGRVCLLRYLTVLSLSRP